jgi:hypothetical protein
MHSCKEEAMDLEVEYGFGSRKGRTYDEYKMGTKEGRREKGHKMCSTHILKDTEGKEAPL